MFRKPLLYNLTKDEAFIIIPFGADRTEPWWLVRLTDAKSAATSSAE